MKTCSKCNNQKEQSEFLKKGRVCKSCYSIYTKEYRSKTRNSRIEYLREYRKNNQDALNKKQADKRQSTMEILKTRCGGKCCVCGYSKSFAALDFHHLNPDDKSFMLSKRYVHGITDELLLEASKCVLLCANCHREYHVGLIQL